MLSQSLKHAMSIYVFWLIVFFSAFIGIFSGYLMSWIESLVSPEKEGLEKPRVRRRELIMAQQKLKRKKSLYQRGKENKKLQAALTVILPVGFGILIFALWQGQILHKMFHTDTYTLPLPTKIGSIFMDNLDKIWENTQSTISVAFIGLVLGSLLGYAVAILASFFPKMGKGG